jgi:hypothetical protein
MQREIASCEENDTWKEVPRPRGAKVIRVKWVYKIKTDLNGDAVQYKARVTPKGYEQVRGKDYFEIFAPTVSYKTLRLVLSLTARWGHKLDQMDVGSAFLHADVHEDVYIELPEGYRPRSKGDVVLKLRKALYGIHQAPREWYLLVSRFIIEVLGFTQCVKDPCLFFKRSKTGRLILLVMFVDDFQVSYHHADAKEWEALKKKFMQRFKTKDMGPSQLMLGMRITRDLKANMLTLDQEVYVAKKLEEFGMADCKPVTTPAVRVGSVTAAGSIAGQQRRRLPSEADADDEVASGDDVMDRKPYMQLVGALLYAALATRPDIAYATHQLTMHAQQPQLCHWMQGKRVLRYLQGTRDVCLQFGTHAGDADDSRPGHDEMVVHGFSDADWATDPRTRRSISGWVVKLNGDTISWSSKMQSVVALSTCEAELYAEAACVQEVLWMRGLLAELGLCVRPQSVVWVDNQSTLQISEHGIIRERTKHVDVKYKFVSELIGADVVKCVYVPTGKQQADILTKALARPAFERLRPMLMSK